MAVEWKASTFEAIFYDMLVWEQIWPDFKDMWYT